MACPLYDIIVALPNKTKFKVSKIRHAIPAHKSHPSPARFFYPHEHKCNGATILAIVCQSKDRNRVVLPRKRYRSLQHITRNTLTKFILRWVFQIYIKNSILRVSILYVSSSHLLLAIYYQPPPAVHNTFKFESSVQTEILPAPKR